ncbi:MAG: helix-turn-helix transcriptional regulator [Verrucomicrobia bacterium]|nr:helix-turn-helix transcriptional regulator [Prolixibacteraceae bacterium]
MEDRIKKFIDYMGITPSELADAIGVQRSNVTHVLKGRNKPSFQFIEKLLQIYPRINAKWLLLGEGSMIEGGAKPPTLFDQAPEPALINKPTDKVEREIINEPPPAPKEPTPPPVIKEKKEPENDLPGTLFGSEKPIERLIVFYNDQTFKVYNPSR